MSATLSLSNFRSKNILETGVLNADVAAAANVILLENPQNYVANSFIIIGTLGDETSEMAQVLSAAGPTITLTAPLSLPHRRFDKVTRLWGDQLKVYSAPNVSGATPDVTAFSPVTSGTVNIDADQLTTLFTDVNGSDSLWYGFTHFNSNTALETNLADSSFARGGGYGNYCSVDDIRENAGFKNNRNIGNDSIDRHRKAAQDEINGRLAARYVVPFTAPINSLISSITTRLSAGFLLVQQFGAFTTLDTNNGQTRIDKARAELKELQEGTMTLTGETGIDAASGAGGFDGLPNNSTYDSATGTGGPMFSVNDVGGQGKY